MKTYQNQNNNKSSNSHLNVFFAAQIAFQQTKKRQQSESLQKLSLGKTVANLHNIHVQHNYKEKSKDKDKQMEKIRYFFRKYQPIYFNNVNMKNFHYNTTNVKIKKYKQANYYGQVNLENGKKQGLGIMVYSNNKVYQGQWKNDQKYGKGYEKFTDGSIYQGQYIDGKPQGLGKLINSNLQLYQGEWKNGLKHGKGFWRGPKGDSYLGQWICGKAQGYGVHTWMNGDKYEGQFKNCLKHGEGIEKFSNGDIYKGTYENGKPSGFGQYFWANKSFFKGYFKNGLRSGHGVWKKGPGRNDKYQGQYSNDKKWGPGVFTWASGNIYKGNYNGDVRNGYGQMYWTNGSYYKGEWLNGVQHGKGQIYMPDLGYRKGKFQNNQIVQVEYQELTQKQQNEDQGNSGNIIQNSSKIVDKVLQTQKSQSQLSVLSKNKMKTNLSKITTIQQQDQRKLQQNSLIQKQISQKKQISIRTKTQNFNIKKKQKKGLSLRMKDDMLSSKQVQKDKYKKFAVQQIFTSPNLYQKDRHSFNGMERSSNNIRSKDKLNAPFFRYTAKQKREEYQKGKDVSELSLKGKNRNDFSHKKKDRLLHSSFYLHRFRNINHVNNNQNNEEHVYKTELVKGANQNKYPQNRLTAFSLSKNKVKIQSDRYSQKHL